MSKSDKPGSGGLSLTKNVGYMQRLREKNYKEVLKEDILFGLVFGWTLFLIGSFKYFILLEKKVWFWAALVGIFFLISSVALPQLLRPLRKAIKFIAVKIGTEFFKIILAIIYFAVVTPIGLLWQRIEGKDPFYTWKSSPPERFEGWCEKRINIEELNTSNKILTLFYPIKVFSYFVIHSELVILPCLILFMILGLMTILVQSSGIAPMIYTLF